MAVIAPLPAALEAPDATGVTVQLDGSASTDPDNDSLTYSWTVDGQAVGQSALVSVKLAPGSHTITLTVKDNRGGVGSATVALQVLAPTTTNRPPVAVIASLPEVIEAPDVLGVYVQLDGTSSSDPDNDPLTYIWRVNGQEVGQGNIVNVSLAVGYRVITLTVTDGRGGIGTAVASVYIMPPLFSNSSARAPNQR